MFSNWQSHSRTYWQGVVRAERFDLENIAGDDREARIAANDAILYNFRIDAVTGMRVDISTGFMHTMSQDELQNRGAAERRAMSEARLWEKDLNEQLAFLGISSADLAAYIQTAQLLADAHFGTEALSGGLANIRSQLGDDGLEVAAIEYVLTHGDREAVITVPTSAAQVGWYGIETNHNDFIPGFAFHDDGTGRG